MMMNAINAARKTISATAIVFQRCLKNSANSTRLAISSTVLIAAKARSTAKAVDLLNDSSSRLASSHAPRPTISRPTTLDMSQPRSANGLKTMKHSGTDASAITSTTTSHSSAGARPAMPPVSTIWLHVPPA